MRKNILTFFLATLTFCSGDLASAQPASKIPRLGFLALGSRSASTARTEAFRQGLRELGYVEGQNIIIEYRYAEGKFARLPDLAAELVRLKVDVVVTAGGSRAVQAAQNATRMIPIVMTGLTDPVAWGFIASLERPSGNITGLSHGGFELIGKRLALLKETTPRASRVAVFWNRASQRRMWCQKKCKPHHMPWDYRFNPLKCEDPTILTVHSKLRSKGVRAASLSGQARCSPLTEAGSWTSRQRSVCPEFIRGGITWRMAA